MKTIEDELSRVRGEIDRLRVEEDLLVRLKAKITGEPVASLSAPVVRKARAVSIKPLVLDLLHKAAFSGMASVEVASHVRMHVPDVAKDTVGSVLSRLKSEGAFVYEKERYFEKQFAPSRASFAHVKPVAPPTAVN